MWAFFGYGSTDCDARVGSRMLSKIGYLRAEGTLFVKFRNGGAVYAYFGAPPGNWQ